MYTMFIVRFIAAKSRNYPSAINSGISELWYIHKGKSNEKKGSVTVYSSINESYKSQVG